MTRWLLAVLSFVASAELAACPLCLGAYRSSTAEQLVDLQRAVLALPTTDQGGYRVVAVIKGERPRGGMIDGADVDFKVPASGTTKTLLLLRDETWPMWVSAGAIGAEHASWVRAIATGKHADEMGADDWRTRLALLAPYLQNAEPLVAQIAYDEFAAAPYEVLRSVKARLPAPAIRQWLADPALAARQPLYFLLLGIAGNAQDAARLEQQLEVAAASGDATNLGQMIAADLQLRGPARMAWVDANYMRERKRSTRELEAVLLALSVHGNANGPIPRERVIESYRIFMAEHKDVAGYVAQDLAAWQYWDAVPEYVALMKSGVKQQYPSKIAIVAYLRRSPAGKAGSIDLPRPEGISSEQSTGTVRKASAIPVLAQ